MTHPETNAEITHIHIERLSRCKRCRRKTMFILVPRLPRSVRFSLSGFKPHRAESLNVCRAIYIWLRMNVRAINHTLTHTHTITIEDTVKWTHFNRIRARDGRHFGGFVSSLRNLAPWKSLKVCETVYSTPINAQMVYRRDDDLRDAGKRGHRCVCVC